MTIQQALAKVNRQLVPKINNALSKEVFEEVRDEEAATIEDVVYGVYTTKMYRRREEHGGLADQDNIVIEGGAATGGRLSVVNVTPPNPGGCRNGRSVTTDKDLPSLVEHGDGYHGYQYDFPGDGDWDRARSPRKPSKI